MIMTNRPLANHALLQSSLRRSAQLGLQVLDRASRRRSVDWWSSHSAASQSQTPSTDGVARTSIQRTHTDLDSAFETIAEFMVQTTDQCKNLYQSDCCTDPTDMEKTHVRRFHSQPTSRTATPALPKRKRGQVSLKEDFGIEVSPGTYSITAGMQDSLEQTQLISINAGESINLTFNL